MKTVMSRSFLFIVIIMCNTACKKHQDVFSKPVAGFSFTIANEGSLPSNVTFTSSAQNADSYSWRFGDGSISTEKNPSHIYTGAGVYPVTLIVTNPAGNDSITRPVSVTLLKPQADFSFTIQNAGQLPCNVLFTGKSLRASSVKWFFGDNGSDTVVNAQHSFSINRTYTVKLVATNASGSDSISKQVTIDPILNSSVVYLVTPRDVKFNQKYYDAVKNCITNLQAWYKTQIGNKTFVLNPLVLDTLTGLHDSAWYNSNNGSISGTDPRFYGFQNTYNEISQRLGTAFNTSKYTYLVYVAAPGGGAGNTGFCALGDQDLKGLLGINPENTNPNRWIGGAGHEFGHSFGLPHPDNQNPQAIMWTGYVTYPNCILQQADKDILNTSPFFK